MKYASNILTVPAESKAAEGLLKVKAGANIQGEVNGHNVVVTRIKEEGSEMLPLTRLDAVANDMTPGKVFRSRFALKALV